MAGLEPTASWSRTKRSTKLSYTPESFAVYRRFDIIPHFAGIVNRFFEKLRFLEPDGEISIDIFLLNSLQSVRSMVLYKVVYLERDTAILYFLIP